jgi:hypothetical protein
MTKAYSRIERRSRMRKLYLWMIALLILLCCGPAAAENYTVEGEMGSQIRFEIAKSVTTVAGVTKLTLSFVVPPTFQSPTYNQDIRGFEMTFSPRPQDENKKVNERGHEVITATWIKPPKTIDVRLSFNASNTTLLKAIDTGVPFPLKDVPEDIQYYLKSTEQVQSGDARIRKLARELTQGVTTEFDAVQRVLSYVIDHVRYVTPPAQYDALYSLGSGKGNCQNFSHLSAALMRAEGVPVRIVNGITLNKAFNLKREGGVLTFKMGQGRHSWIEVWFPDLGWVPFDPQQTAMFVSNRYIRIETGADNNETVNDGLMRWAQRKDSPGEPNAQETINGDFGEDKVNVTGKRQDYGPKNLLLVPYVKAEFKKIEVLPPPPPPVITEEERKELRFDVPFIYGNLDFPENIDFAFPPTPVVSRDKGNFQKTKSFFVETAEYVTTKLTQYAQVFVLKKPIQLKKVGLAVHKFGGDGQLWIDLFKDNNGKPGEPISTSELVSLDDLSEKPGYRWQDFEFKDTITLMPGSYWIGLGFTGSPVLNWFYTYGKPVGPVEGTRYKGVYEEDWSGALSFEFNYRVAGMTTK